MAAPETSVSERVAAIADATFAAEITAGDITATEHDKFGRSAGMELASGKARMAVSADEAREDFRRVIELVVPVTFQFYMAYDAEPDETIVRDPREIQALAARLREEFNETSGPGADHWFIRCKRIEYPDDPTGNKTRFTAEIEGRCANPAALPS